MIRNRKSGDYPPCVKEFSREGIGEFCHESVGCSDWMLLCDDQHGSGPTTESGECQTNKSDPDQFSFLLLDSTAIKFSYKEIVRTRQSITIKSATCRPSDINIAISIDCNTITIGFSTSNT